MEDNKDLYELMGDLRDIGIGEDRVYFRISYKRTLENTIYIIPDILPVAKIIVTSLNKSKERIRISDILFELLTPENYKVELEPDYVKGLTESHKRIRFDGVSSYIHNAIKRLTDDKLIDLRFFMNDLINEHILEADVDLFIDGTLVYSETSVS